MSVIHETAIVHESAKIGENVFIGPFSIVGENCEIGDNTKINPHVIISKNTKIGKNNKFFQYCAIGEQAEMKKMPEDFDKSKLKTDILEIGDDNTFREFVSIHRGSPYHEGLTKIGDRNFFTAHAHIGHDCVIGNDNVFVACLVAGHVVVENNSTIGGGSAIHQFCRIGSYAMVGGMTGIVKDILPYSLISSKDSSFGALFGVNSVGLQRANFSEGTITKIKNYFKIIRKYTGISAILEQLELLPPDEYLNNIKNFIKNSESRGILLR